MLFRVFSPPKLSHSLHDIIDSQASPGELLEQKGKRQPCWTHRDGINPSPLTWKKGHCGYLQFLHCVSRWSFSCPDATSLIFWYFVECAWNWPLFGENGLSHTQTNNTAAHPIFLYKTKPASAPPPPPPPQMGTHRFSFSVRFLHHTEVW